MYKYIVFINVELRLESILMFPKFESHVDIAMQMNLKDEEIISAGFATLQDGKFKCFGRSHSLGIESRPDVDTLLANKYLTF